MTQLATAAAADRLGVSQRQVQRLIAAGGLPASRTAGDAWMVDALVVNAMTRARPARGRPWSPGTAWAALWQLSGLDADWPDRRSARRLSERLASLDAEGVLLAARRRAVVHRLRVVDSLIEELTSFVVRSGTSAMTPGVFGMGRDAARVDGYCDDGSLAALVHDFHLIDDPRGNVALRTAALRTLSIGDRDEMPVAVVAADLAESLEVRERTAGIRVIESLLV